MILDDYHVIDSVPVHEGVTYLLEHLPGQMHLVIAARGDPPLPLSRLRGRGIMLEIRTDDLRFNREETGNLAGLLKVPPLAEMDVAALTERTEGWAVGLKMALLSMSGQKDSSRFIADFTGSQHYVMDYLMDEVLAQQTPEMVDFLLQTSILERLSAPLCDAVTGGGNGNEMLARLENDSLFVVPLDETRQWYRYEHLFAELLRHELTARNGEAAMAELHQRASGWYEEHGFTEDAIHHALAARDWATAARLLKSAGPLKEKQGEIITLLEWYRALPAEVLRDNPHLYLQHAKLLATSYQPDAAEAALLDLETVAGQDTRLRGKIASARMTIAQTRGDIEREIEHGRAALSLLPEDDLEERGFVCGFLGRIQFHRNNYTEAESLLAEAIEAGRRTGAYMTVAYSATWVSTILHFKGRLHDAFELCRRTVDAMPDFPPVALVLAYMGMISYEWNDLEASLAYLKRATELSYAIGPEAKEWILNQLARTLLAMGDENGAMETLAKIDKLIQDTADKVMTFRSQTISFHIETALRQGDLKTAKEWGGRLSDFPTEGPFILQARFHLLIAEGRKVEASARLQRVYAMIPPVKLGLIVVRILQAEAAENTEQGASFLADALYIAEPEGFFRVFANERMALVPLLRNLISCSNRPEYARKLLATIEKEERRRKIRKGETPPAAGPLSEREIEVVRLLAEGLSNQQIAARLVISPSTAKNHVHKIIDKLETRSRTQAVTRARELGLI